MIWCVNLESYDRCINFESCDMVCELGELGYDVLPWRVMNVVCELGEL